VTLSDWGDARALANCCEEVARLTRLLRHHEAMAAELHDTNQELRRRLGIEIPPCGHSECIGISGCAERWKDEQ